MMVDPVALWHTDHMRFARMLNFLKQQIAEFHAGGHPDYELMRDIVHYLHHFGDRFHHPREDVAFDRLLKHDPSRRDEISRLLQEHRVIDQAGATLLKHLEDILNDVMIDRATVEAAAATYLVYYRQHLQAEESEILPHAAYYLTPEDWAAVADAVPNVPDPLFGDDVGARYRELRDRLIHRKADA